MYQFGPNGRRARFPLAVAVIIVLLLAAGAGATGAALADERGLVTRHEWERFKARFVMPDGRVVDHENGGITHSESQGYGMILAVYAHDRAAFDRIWGFARRELQIREGDSLLAWRWDPRRSPRVIDTNNATDGDVLVAYALLRAAALWSDIGYAREADAIVDDIGDNLVERVGGRTVLRAAAYGFDSIPGNRGPVVNPSYYVFAAFPLFEVVRPEHPWREIARDGLRLLVEARTGRKGLVPDWVALAGSRVRIASGFRPRSSYDAVRVPLYLVHGRQDPDVAATFDEAWNIAGGGRPLDYHLGFETPLATMGDPGYRAIAALIACARRGTPIPPSLAEFRPTTYFASSLHLLALAAMREHHPRCLPGTETASAIHLASRSHAGYVPQAGRTTSHVAASAAPGAHRHAVRVAGALPGRSRARHMASAGAGLSFSDRIMRKTWLPRR